MYYDRQGRPMDQSAWQRRFSDYDYKVVARTAVSGWSVSTVWLGMDLNYAGQGPPVIFETMVFPPEGLATEGEYCMRYATEAEARAGHEEAVRWTKETIANFPPVWWRVVPDDFNTGRGS
jgi:hypothetical protein